jgi:hypothetical protein
MREYQRTTDEQIIEAVNKYMETYPNASRNKIILHATGSGERVRKLAREGKINLPVPLPRGSNSNWTRYFKFEKTA